jgi:hypothetical protein
VLTSFGYHLDEDLLISFLRKVMPPYHGFDTLLFRGQGRGPVGVSWTPSPGVALRFALVGFDRQKKVKDYRADAVILPSSGAASAIFLLQLRNFLGLAQVAEFELAAPDKQKSGQPNGQGVFAVLRRYANSSAPAGTRVRARWN